MSYLRLCRAILSRDKVAVYNCAPCNCYKSHKQTWLLQHFPPFRTLLHKLSAQIVIVFLFARPFVKRFALCYQTVVLSVCPVLSVTLMYCGQTVGWIKTKLDMQVGLVPGHIALDEDPAPLPQRGTALQFLAHICGSIAGWIKMPLGREI